jgi:hypothetical protein
LGIIREIKEKENKVSGEVKSEKSKKIISNDTIQSTNSNSNDKIKIEKKKDKIEEIEILKDLKKERLGII